MPDGMRREEIAIIGMAGHFPGAAGVEAFWKNLRDGVESLQVFTAEDLKFSGVDPAVLRDPAYVSAGGLLEEAHGFDASFFGYTPREAEIMDPQHRRFLECAWEALESAGYAPETSGGSIGVFAGVARNTYLLNNVALRRDLVEDLGLHAVFIGNDKDYVATRVSFKLNLTGPSVNIQSACSTSGVAVHLACQSLLAGECDIALAGGGRIQVPLTAGYMYQEGGILSPDGHCRAFDAGAKGTVIGSGVAIVVLKRLSDALADGDHIHAVIKGSAINNDGSAKAGFTAPSIEGQSAVIAEALAMADAPADTIGYVEAHGTGTAIGDPIEIAALTRAFRRTSERTGFCAIGSVKTNIGHLDAGAGVAGIIKTALALEHREIPPSLHYESPNPEIDFARSPFYVNAELSEWPSNSLPRRAGVSCFGLGGTNAHLVLEEAPVREASVASRPWHLLTLSAKSPAALESLTGKLGEHLAAHPEIDLADAAYTLQVGRRRFAHRRTIICSSREDALGALAGRDSKFVSTQQQEATQRPVAFLFPGGGAQYPNMALDLYRSEPVFAEHLDSALALLEGRHAIDLRADLFPESSRYADARARLTSPMPGLPTLFVTEYALARLWMSWGVRPTAMVGHSLGEYVAACLAGVLSLESALALVVLRARLFERLPAGGMLSVPLPEADVRALIGSQLCIAAVNGPSLSVVSGPGQEIEQLKEKLLQREIETVGLQISVAAHSAMVEPILEEFGAFVRTIAPQPPRIPYVSNVTGQWVTPAETSDPGYWPRHLRGTVRFAEGLATLAEIPDLLLLEVGPGRTLTNLAQQQRAGLWRDRAFPSLRHPQDQVSDAAVLVGALARLWLSGAEIDWRSYHARAGRRRVPLPTYPFERKRYWIEAPSLGAALSERSLRSEPIVQEGGADSAGREFLPQKDSATGRSVPETLFPPIPDRHSVVLRELTSILHQLSGVDPAKLDPSASFLELGFESLFLTQASAAFTRRLGVKVTMRQLLEGTPSLSTLAAYIHENLPAEAFREDPALLPAPGRTPEAGRPPTGPQSHEGVEPATSVSALGQHMAEQLRSVSAQLENLRATFAAFSSAPVLGGTAASESVRPAPAPAYPGATRVVTAGPQEGTRSVGQWKPIPKAPGGGLTARQQEHLDRLIESFTRKTAGSKRLTQQHRKGLADPRTVAGFRPAWKELVYPIVATRAAGSRLWDVDGNEWLDITSGYGITLFGHAAPFVVEAVEKQLRESFAIGPQTPLAGKVADLIREFTGMERVAFCNTGSEAVLAAIRVARTVTGRERIALFSGDYHGIFDEVLVKGITVDGARRSVPVAPGIPPRMVENVLVLDYGSGESLAVLEENAEDLAAVLVEPVQSRRPDLQPREFLHRLRELTARRRVPLVFDEVITGFRVDPGGAQAYFGVKADIASYGKVIGGGLPIGVVAGKAEYLDALDGGMWSFGDDSVPEKGVTWFAGTFVRHPLALAAAHAVLTHLKTSGPRLQQDLNEKTARFAAETNAYLERRGFPIRISHFASLFLIEVVGGQEFSGLLWHHLRAKGIHAQEGRPNFLTTAHTDEDIAFLSRAFQESVEEMREGGFFPEAAVTKPERGILPTTDSHEPTDRAGGEGSRTVPVTNPQEEVWAAAQMGGDASRAFNETYRISLEGRLDEDAMRGAVRKLIARHEALRATFTPDGESQVISPALELEIPFRDLSDWDPPRREAAVEEEVREVGGLLYDLVSGPLVRIRLIRLSATSHLLLFGYHHSICDGWSGRVMLRELALLYEAECEGRPARLPKATPYSDYVDWQAEERKSPRRIEAEAYWLELLRAPLPVLQLPTDHPRVSPRSYRAGFEGASIDGALYEQFKRLAARNGCTPTTALLAVFQVLLSRLSGQTDLIVGIPTAGQNLFGGETLVGHCVNLLPLRSRLDLSQPFSAYLASVRALVLDSLDHQTCTFGSLLPKLDVRRDPSRVPLVEVIFTLDLIRPSPRFGQARSDVSVVTKRFLNFDLFLNFVESKDALIVEWTYSSDLFEASTIRRWIGHLQALLQGIIADPARPLQELPLLTEAERRLLLVEWNRTGTDYPREACLHELFEAQAERAPARVAVVFKGEELTYGELNRRSNQLAHHLRALGIGPEVLVPICVERSLEMVAGLLAVLKSGGAYVPLDPAYPKERLAGMLQESQAPVLLTQQRLLSNLPKHAARTVCLDAGWNAVARESGENPPNAAGPDNLAYVIYTSGSTGRPKGAAIEHRSAVNLACWAREVYGAKELSGVFASTSICFDLSVFELFVPLSWGGKVVLGENVLELPALAASSEVVLVNAVPSAMTEVLRLGLPPSVKTVNLAGEPLSPRLVAEIYQQGVKGVFDLYGPSESTTYSTYVLRDPDGPATIGRPIANTRVFILDRNREPAPIGVPGELYIGGDGLARGYLNDPALTAEKFVANPFGGEVGSRLYKTGDLARYLADGNVEFLGRLDNQVKIRGFRIEPGEIESVLAQHQSVAGSVVVPREDTPGDRRLVAYVVPRDGESLSVTQLRVFLKTKLPDYMVPAAFVFLDAFPLTPSGKVNRRALPAPEQAPPGLEDPFIAPRDSIEEALAGIWSRVLGVKRVGVEDNFFALGGHSLLATQVISRVRDAFGVELPLRALFEAPTVAGLAVAMTRLPVEDLAPEEISQNLAALVPSADAERPAVDSEDALTSYGRR